MKLEEYIESIFGCLERIENKINGLSVPLPEGNSPTVNNEKEKDESVLNEVLKGHETFVDPRMRRSCRHQERYGFHGQEELVTGKTWTGLVGNAE
jgi:hypothetical protein